MMSVDQLGQRVRGVFYGWWIVLGAIVVQATLSGLLNQSYGSYIVVMQAELGWAATIFAIGSAVQQVEHGLLGPVQGWLLNRFGIPAMMRVGFTLYTIGFVLFSQVSEIPMFFLAFALMAMGASLGGFLTLSTALVNWFHRKRTTVMGMAAMGISLGGLAAPLIATSITNNGWRTTALISAGFAFVVGMALSRVIRQSPEPYGLLPDGDIQPAGPIGARPAGTGTDFTTRQALRSPAFWFINIGHASAILIVSTVFVYLVPHVTRTLGVSIEVAASAVAVFTGISIPAQLFGGAIGDKFEKRYIAVICMVAHIAGLIILAFATEYWMVLLFAVLHGIAWGVRGPLMNAIRADYFGRSSFATIAGFSSLVTMLGSISGPAVSAVLADRTGDFRTAFLVLAAMAAVGSLAFLFAKNPNAPYGAAHLPPERQRTAP